MLLALAAAASLAEFEAALAAKDSATAALQQWCAVRQIASPPQIRALRGTWQGKGHGARPPGNVAAQLRLRRGEQFAFRHVRLVCGDTVMSEAYNWYVPARLTPEMNTALASGETPFGTVIAPLQFRRERLDAGALLRNYCPAGSILAHRARLMRPDGRPLAMLIECYTPDNLTAPAAE